VIQQYLVNAGQQTLIKNEVAALRKEAKVEFFGDFSTLTLDSKPAAVPATTPAAAKADAPALPTAPAAPVEAAPESNKHDKAIEKGLSGL
jgi:hypothetical protein